MTQFGHNVVLVTVSSSFSSKCWIYHSRSVAAWHYGLKRSWSQYKS